MSGCGKTSELLTKPAPAEALVRCPAIPEPASASQDDHSAAYGALVIEYGKCALRHDELIDHYENP